MIFMLSAHKLYMCRYTYLYKIVLEIVINAFSIAYRC